MAAMVAPGEGPEVLTAFDEHRMVATRAHARRGHHQLGVQGQGVRLLREAPRWGSVQTVKLPNQQTVWLVSRYDDVAALLKDARLANCPSRTD